MDKIKGLIFVAIIVFISKFTGSLIDPFVKLEVLTIGIVLGILVNNTIGYNDSYKAGVDFSLKRLLKYGIIFLGFKINFLTMINQGYKMLIVVILFVPGVIYISGLIGKKLGVDERLAGMIGVGSSICGASAIVAMAPLFPGNKEEKENLSVIAVSIVSFLGALGVLIYTQIGVISSISDIQFGLWSGLSLHGVAHALAGAFSRGDLAGEYGTIIKMMRVIMLVPVSVFLSIKYSDDRKESSGRLSIPYYVVLFIIAGIINTLGILPEELVSVLKMISSYFILMAMISMGLKVDFKNIKEKGKQALIVGTIVFIISSSVAYILVKNIF